MNKYMKFSSGQLMFAIKYISIRTIAEESKSNKHVSDIWENYKNSVKTERLMSIFVNF